jgi:hypothetical protein
MISMKVNTKLAIALFASASSLLGVASGALAGTPGGAQVTGGDPNAYTSRNAAAAATFTTINGIGTTGSASAAIGNKSAAATASNVVNFGLNDGYGYWYGYGSSIQGGIVNNATAIGSDSDITVKVGGTGTGNGVGTGEINLNSNSNSRR